MAEWQQSCLGRVARHFRGYSYSSAELNEDGDDFISLKVFEKGGGFRSDGVRAINGPVPERFRVPAGAVLVANTDLTRNGDVVGVPAVVPPQFDGAVFSMHATRCVPDSDLLDDRFLALALGAPEVRAFMRGSSAGSTVLNLDTSRLDQVPLLLPPLEEQRRIAEVLETVDATIQATERVLAKLATISSALGEASLSGVGTDDLVRLGDECRVLGGKRLPAGHAYSPTQTQYRYLRVVDFYRRNVDYESLAALSESTFHALRRYEIRSGELFISIAGSIGHVGVNQPPSGMKTILTENAARIVPSGSLVPGFLALQMNSRGVREQVRAEIGTGGGVPKLALHRVANLRVSCPDISVQKEVARRHEIGWATQDAETRKLDKLRKLRAGLAADLLSGRVRTVAA